MLRDNITTTSGVGGGASGASADAPRVGHRWQSDTDGSLIQFFKKRKKREKSKGKETEKKQTKTKWD